MKIFGTFLDTGAMISSGTTSSPKERTFALVYDAVTGKELLRMPQEGEIKRAAFSPDGRKILTSSTPPSTPGERIRLWNAEDGRQLFGVATMGSPDVGYISPDGKKIAIFSRQRIHIHGTETG